MFSEVLVTPLSACLNRWWRVEADDGLTSQNIGELPSDHGCFSWVWGFGDFGSFRSEERSGWSLRMVLLRVYSCCQQLIPLLLVWGQTPCSWELQSSPERTKLLKPAQTGTFFTFLGSKPGFVSELISFLLHKSVLLFMSASIFIWLTHVFNSALVA